jgi:hypothetical protein
MGRYVQFDENGISTSIYNSENKPEGDGWYIVPDSFPNSPHFKLSNNMISIMTNQEVEEWKRPLRLNALILDTRVKRDDLLSKCDWTELPSVKANKTEEWIVEWETYRQALRDIPSSITDPDALVSWPTPPSK